MGFVVIIVSLILLFLITEKRIEVGLTLEKFKVFGTARLLLFFGMLKIPVRFVIFYRLGEGLMISRQGGKARVIRKKTDESRKKLDFKAFTSVEELHLKGELGINGAPDKSVILSGLLQTVLLELSLCVYPKKPDVLIVPSLNIPVFKLNLEGIVLFMPGKFILEEIKSRRRKTT